MKRVIRNLLLLILMSFLLIAGSMVYGGYRSYLEKTERLPIETAVEEHQYADDVSYDKISPYFIEAVVATEDQRFFERNGYDWIALVRAVINNFRLGWMAEGASTIPEQIAKNLYFTDISNRGFRDKIAEVFIMEDLESRYSRKELFCLYVNMNYYGDSYWGIYQASEGYYGKEPADLTLAQSAMLAGIPNAPGLYQLSSGYDRAKERQKKVLERMVNEKYIGQEEADQAYLEDVRPISIQ